MQLVFADWLKLQKYQNANKFNLIEKCYFAIFMHKVVVSRIFVDVMID